MRGRLPAYVVTTLLRAAIAALCVNLAMAFVLRDALNAAVQQDAGLLRRALVLAVGAFFIGEPTLALVEYIHQGTVIATMTRLRQAAFAKMAALPVRRFEREHSGDLLTRLTSNIQDIEDIYQEDLTALAYGLAYSGFALALIFGIEWRMGALILAINLVNIVIGLAFRRPRRRVNDAIQRGQVATTERFLDLFRGLTVVKMFHVHGAALARFRRAHDEVTAAHVRQGAIDALSGLAGNLYGTFKYLGVLAVGLLLVMEGQTDLGAIGAIIFMQSYASIFFEELGHFIPQVQASLAGADRVLALLDWPTEEEQRAEAAVPARRYPIRVYGAEHRGSLLRLADVHFGYGLDDREDGNALRGLDMAVNRGEMAALVGPSGGGKSTVLKLIMGFYPLQQGRILVAGRDIEDYTLEALRRLFAYVPQDAYLFEGTIAENIRYGRPGAPEEAVVAAARAANAHRFIVDQPSGYETVVGERGARLSGGERQRIAIARALLKDAPILLLDEATSALDSASERLVQEALDVLREGRTTVAVAHRLSTVEHADVIYVIDRGRVVERGRHELLLARGGLYRRLHELQFRNGA
jgi:ABC-type multidrug transport system fused ATPase/permease subunit